MAKRSKILTFLLPAVGLTALFAGGVVVALDRPQRDPEAPPREPTTAPTTAGLTQTESFIGAVGITEPPGEAIAIASHTAGVVDAVLVNLGDRVAAGDPLFRIDTRRAERQVEQRRAEVAAAEADVTALRGQIPVARAAVSAAQAQVDAAEASVAASEADLADLRNRVRIAEAIGDRRAISEEELETRRFAAARGEARVQELKGQTAQARASLEEARAQLALLVKDSDGDPADGPDIRAAEARLERARADLAAAQTELALLTVRAPVDGSVIQINLRPGEFAPAKELTEGLVVLAREGGMRVRVQIDEVDIARFERGAKAWGSPRGDAQRRIALEFVAVEPLVVPKRNLSGRTSELVDTRVMEVIYAVAGDGGVGAKSLEFGQQVDVYIEAEPIASGKAAGGA